MLKIVIKLTEKDGRLQFNVNLFGDSASDFEKGCGYAIAKTAEGLADAACTMGYEVKEIGKRVNVSPDWVEEVLDETGD